MRMLLTQGAQNVLNSACPSVRLKTLANEPSERPAERTAKTDDIHQFARQLRARKPRNVVVAAIANRMARMLYVLLKHGVSYRANRVYRNHNNVLVSKEGTLAAQVKKIKPRTTESKSRALRWPELGRPFDRQLSHRTPSRPGTTVPQSGRIYVRVAHFHQKKTCVRRGVHMRKDESCLFL